MQEILKEISEFINNGLSFLGLKEFTLEAVLGQATQVVMQIIASIILFIFVKVFLWSKITALIEERQEIINKNLNEAQQLNQEALAQKTLADEEYKVAKEEARKIIAEANKFGSEERDRIVNDAKEEAKRRLLMNQKEIEIEVENARENIKNAIVDIAMLVAEKIIKHEISQEDYEKVVYDFIEEVGSK